MASRLWLALLLFQLATAAPTPSEGSVEIRGVEAANAPVQRDTIIERDDDINWDRFGTNENSPLIGQPAREHRAGVDYVKALLDPTKQPAIFQLAHCSYAYSHQATTGTLSLWESGTSPLIDVNVAQGGVGDCGFGSSIGAIALTGHSQYLKDRVKVNGTTWEFKFTWKGEDHIVRVDDQLPAATGGENCNGFLGYQPAGPTTKSWYVPLAEKAAAKLLDAYPEIRSNPNSAGGYNAMKGIWPDRALALLTGQKGTQIWRQRPGLDEGIVKALEKCLTSPEPCVLGSSGVSRGDKLFGSEEFPDGWKAPHGESYVSAVFHNSTTRPNYWDGVDYDLQDAHNTLVPNHAWAFDKRKTNYTPGADLRKVRVRMLNPWGLNPKPWQQTDAKNAVDLSFTALASFIDSVFTLEDI
ncbi:hypothetical protein A1Q2_02380 [Trichosporon asahii var. asahii CBS 8904]|uniref:Calpain catalytic domain-containing protein n=1 Tax=Trichosporon asahii var. asahii (strain CBS 8904) TaxID=1220162 RepID=K1VGN3_TRIAC|nr:hypothetical protein A1Q2_02380 [Trichosporon asahii var. asahii CBS 8904]